MSTGVWRWVMVALTANLAVVLVSCSPSGKGTSSVKMGERKIGDAAKNGSVRHVGGGSETIMRDGLRFKYEITHVRNGKTVMPPSWIAVSFSERGDGLFEYRVETPSGKCELNPCDKWFRDPKLGDSPILLDGLGPIWLSPASLRDNDLGASFKVVGRAGTLGHDAYKVVKTINGDFIYFYDSRVEYLMAIRNPGAKVLPREFTLTETNLEK